MSSWIFTSLVIYYDKSSSVKLLDLSQTRFVYSAWNLWTYSQQNCIVSHVSNFLLWYFSTLLKILKLMCVVFQFHELGSILAYFCLLISLQNKFKILNSYFASVCVFHIFWVKCYSCEPNISRDSCFSFICFNPEAFETSNHIILSILT